MPLARGDNRGRVQPRASCCLPYRLQGNAEGLTSVTASGTAGEAGVGEAVNALFCRCLPVPSSGSDNSVLASQL